MNWFQSSRGKYIAVAIGSALLGLVIGWPLFAVGQDKNDSPAKHAPPADQNKDLVEHIKLLNAKVARLEAAVAKSTTSTDGMPGMGTGTKKPAMGMMDDDMMGMGGKKMSGKKPAMGMMDDDMMMPGKKPAMGMMDDDMMNMGDKKMGGTKPAMGMMEDDMMGGMDMDMMEMMGMMGMAPKSAGNMSGMKNMSKMQMIAALPGFPGASHIYHIGATDFFLNHPEHIDLTRMQQGALVQLKEKALLAKSTAQRKIDEGEQELWTLTSADEPDAAKIDAKIQEIGKLRSDQRMGLIRAVGEAAKLLTDEQRMTLLGTGAAKMVKPDADQAAKPDPHANHKQP